MRLVIAYAACQTVSVGWSCWTRNCNLRTGCVHICSETPNVASQSAASVISASVVHVGELEWIHIGVADRLQMRKDCQSLQHLHHHWRHSHGAVVVQRFWIFFNRSMNTGVNSSAQWFIVEVETLSGPAAVLLLCCLNSFSHLVLLHIEGRREWYSGIRQTGRYRCRLGTNKYSVIFPYITGHVDSS